MIVMILWPIKRITIIEPINKAMIVQLIMKAVIIEPNKRAVILGPVKTAIKRELFEDWWDPQKLKVLNKIFSMGDFKLDVFLWLYK